MKTQILCAMRDGSAVIPALRTLEDEQDCAFRMVQSGEGALSAAKKMQAGYSGDRRGAAADGRAGHD
ncbi:MAG: hypothetical protein ACLVB5_15515 [Christensenellales bacterium]